MSDKPGHKSGREDDSGWVAVSPKTGAGGLPTRRVNLRAAFERLVGGQQAGPPSFPKERRSGSVFP